MTPDPAPPVGPDEFAALMAPLGPFGPAPRLALGVSGGPHSLALAALGLEWAAARGGAALALVADHGLRSGSGAEAEGVAATLRALGLPSRVLALAVPPGPALQERARVARMAALLDGAAGFGAPWLLLGHHRGDQAETLAFRLFRGSGADGLAAMAPARAAPGALVLRPLLSIPAARLEALLAARGLRPVRDPSNDDARFARARLRAALADPGAEGPGVAALAGAAAAFAARRARRAGRVADRLAACAAFHPEGWARLDRAALGRDEVAAPALAALLRAVSGRPHPPPRDGVAALLARGGGTLGGALWRGGVLCREPSAVAGPVAAVPGAVWDGRWRVVAAEPGLTLGALGEGAGAAPRGGMPSAVLAGLPALRRDGVLVSVPALGWPGAAAARLALEPASGPAA